jgi:hypothetical protein
MPQIDTVKRITVEEFKEEDREIAERIGNIYNYFAEQVTNIINGKLDFDNMNRAILTLEIIVDSNGNPLQTSQFTTSVGLRGTTIINAVNNVNFANYVNSHPYISFTSDGTGRYTINNIKGLRPNEAYTLTIELVF